MGYDVGSPSYNPVHVALVNYLSLRLLVGREGHLVVSGLLLSCTV